MYIVTDGTADMPNDVVEKYPIVVIPLNIMFGEQVYLSEVTMSKDEFYEKVKTVNDANFPKTSQPTPYQVLEALEPLIEAGETEFLFVTVSSTLSGTHQSAVLARKELAGRATLHIFDSMHATATQGYMVLEAAKMTVAGASVDDIIARLTTLRDSAYIGFFVESLKFAVRGGRISLAKSLLAVAFSIRPLFEFHDGKTVEVGKVRTRKKAILALLDNAYKEFGDTPIDLMVLHCNAPAEGDLLLNLAIQRFNVRTSNVFDMTLGVAINAGPETIGLGIIPVG